MAGCSDPLVQIIGSAGEYNDQHAANVRAFPSLHHQPDLFHTAHVEWSRRQNRNLWMRPWRKKDDEVMGGGKHSHRKHFGVFVAVPLYETKPD